MNKGLPERIMDDVYWSFNSKEPYYTPGSFEIAVYDYYQKIGVDGYWDSQRIVLDCPSPPPSVFLQLKKP
jgi:hypothetical protein